MMSLWDALRMNMMISYQELVRTFPNWACTGKVKLPYYKAGLKKVIYLKSDLDDYLKSTRRLQA